MEDMKHTAVEWFFDELYSIRKTIPFEYQADAILKAFEQAKAMEKEQIESLLEKAIQERDYYYDLWKKANAYIVKK